MQNAPRGDCYRAVEFVKTLLSMLRRREDRSREVPEQEVDAVLGSHFPERGDNVETFWGECDGL
jgi:hypothetical protein